MIRHCVFIRFRPAAIPAERQAIYDFVAGLQEKVDGIRGVWFGRNVNREKLAKGFDEGFIVDFRDAEAQRAYDGYPGHAAISGRLVAAAEGGEGGIFVFDMEIG